MRPYPFQEANVERIATLRKPRRLWVLDETGLGKSVTAILAAKCLHVRRMLVVTRGMVRPAWLDRFKQWWPERADDVASITAGRNRAGLSGPALWRLRQAYNAPLQIVSYDLLGEVEQRDWDMIVLDEMHGLVSYGSAAAAKVRNIFRINPNATRLGLTATILTAEPKNLWTLLKLFEPDAWGKPVAERDPPWWFLRKYSVRYENEFGVSYKGLNEDAAPELEKVLRERSVRTRRQDVQDLLPPIDCEPLVIEASNKRPDHKVVLDWLDNAVMESAHVAVIVYHRAEAQALHTALRSLPRYAEHELVAVTGEQTPEARQKRIALSVAAPRSVLIGTMDAIGTGISLTAYQQYLIAESVSTPTKLVQLLGRFSRLDSGASCRGFVLMREGRDDDKIATLRRRLNEFNQLLKQGQGEAALGQVLNERDTGAFDRRLDVLIASFTGMDAIDEGQEPTEAQL